MSHEDLGDSLITCTILNESFVRLASAVNRGQGVELFI